MPHLTVKVHEEALNPTTQTALIRELTQALVAVYGERARPLAVVELFGTPRERWGTGGALATANTPVVTLTIREAALHTAGTDADTPRRLIASLTDAVTGVFGEEIRAGVTVVIDAIPAGRSGTAGQPV